MPPKEAPVFQIDAAQIVFGNFAGRAKEFNAEGDRNFAVILTEEIAAVLQKDGWNVKRLKGQDCPPDVDRCGDWYIPVEVSFDNYPPNITMITNRGETRTRITEDMCEILDGMEFSNVDIIIRGYNWLVNGKKGVKAYLKTGFFTVMEDELELRYAESEAHQ